jgi:hypothetical protein
MDSSTTLRGDFGVDPHAGVISSECLALDSAPVDNMTELLPVPIYSNVDELSVSDPANLGELTDSATPSASTPTSGAPRTSLILSSEPLLIVYDYPTTMVTDGCNMMSPGKILYASPHGNFFEMHLDAAYHGVSWMEEAAVAGLLFLTPAVELIVTEHTPKNCELVMSTHSCLSHEVTAAEAITPEDDAAEDNNAEGIKPVTLDHSDLESCSPRVTPLGSSSASDGNDPDLNIWITTADTCTNCPDVASGGRRATVDAAAQLSEILNDLPVSQQRQCRDDIETMICGAKRRLESEAEERARGRLAHWQQQKLSLQQCIDESLGGYAEMHEIATALRIKFENEARLFEEKMRTTIRAELDVQNAKLNTYHGSNFQYSSCKQTSFGGKNNGNDGYYSNNDPWSTGRAVSPNDAEMVNDLVSQGTNSSYQEGYGKSVADRHFYCAPRSHHSHETEENGTASAAAFFVYSSDGLDDSIIKVTQEPVQAANMRGDRAFPCTVSSVKDVFSKPLKKFAMPSIRKLGDAVPASSEAVVS